MKSKTFLTYSCLVMLVLSSFLTHAQQYDRSAGVRLGGTSGLTYKRFVAGEQAIETIISGRKNGMQVTALFLVHHPMYVSFNENFFFYYGVGGHLGVEKHGDIEKVIFNDDPSSFYYEEKTYLTMGIDAMIGIEYRMLGVPITLSLDMKPYLNYVGFRKLHAHVWDASIAIKYVF